LLERWSLCTRPEDYDYSSACYYEKGRKHFDFLKIFEMSFEIDFGWINEDDIWHFYKPGTDLWDTNPGEELVII